MHTDGGRQASLSLSNQEKRTSFRSLWAFGVGAVISGNYFGWNFALSGGFGGALVMWGLTAAFYTVLSSCVAEMAMKLPQAKASYSLVVAGNGKFWGFLTGISDIVKMIAMNAALVSSISTYTLRSDNFFWHFLIWAASLLSPLLLSALGAKETSHIQAPFTILAVLLLIAFYVGAMFVGNFEKYALGDGWFLNGFSGFAEGLPFMTWMFWGVEQIPFAVVEAQDPSITMPKVVAATVGVVTKLSLFTIGASSRLPPGIEVMVNDAHPLLTAYQTMFKSDVIVVNILIFLILIVLELALNDHIYAGGDLVYSMAVDGYLPSKLGHLHKKSETPVTSIALTACSSLALVTILFLGIGLQKYTQSLVILTIAASVVSYIIQLCAFVKLRWMTDGNTPEDQPNKKAAVLLESLVLVLGSYLAV
eukprot:CAMPEP_0117763994 /NCGR_PEP_ID=MMETSP0947-20121206/19079_1 /TAXON_ID=44440 /ORGANISM="Chattonella subsalsa, Strain CCMP2191" /LENGTH=419 /DNA_ID=CAMNT_0005586027 /DNA_START=121 /DNA_END=1381 /DNA_ORIENTATION=-